MQVTINIMSNQDPHLINVTLITCNVTSPPLQSSLFHTWAVEFDKTLKRPWDLSLVSNIIGFHSFSSHALQAQLGLCSKDDFCYTCNANQTQNFKYHTQILSSLSTSLQPDITSCVFSSPLWFQVDHHPLMYLDTEKHYHTEINLSVNASIQWCSCISSLKLQQSSLHVMFIISEDVTVLYSPWQKEAPWTDTEVIFTM